MIYYYTNSCDSTHNFDFKYHAFMYHKMNSFFCTSNHLVLYPFYQYLLK